MTRSCVHHESYLTPDDIRCSQFGDVSTHRCSGCTAYSMRELPPQVEANIVVVTGFESTRIGDRLAKLIESEIGIKIGCGECRSSLYRLNAMTSAEVIGSSEEIAESIRLRAISIAPKWWQRFGATLLPSVANSKLQSLIIKAANHSLKK